MTSGNLTVGDAGSHRKQVQRSFHAWAGVFDVAGLGGVVAAIAAWYLASAAMGPVLPMPHQVLGNALTNLVSSSRLPGIGLPRGGYLPHLLYTTYDVVVGGGLGAIVGVTIGLLSAESRVIRDLVAPLVAVLGTTPIVIMAPFFLMWFGLSGVAQVALVAIYTATVLHIFSFRGACNLPAALYDYAATLGARPLNRFLFVRLPGTLPEIFGGLRIAISAAWGLAVVTEMLGGQYGSGRLLVALRSVYDLTGIMAVILLLGVFAIAVDAVILAARAYFLRWATAHTKAGMAA